MVYNILCKIIQCLCIKNPYIMYVATLTVLYQIVEKLVRS